jgi:hypothetical protein
VLAFHAACATHIALSRKQSACRHVTVIRHYSAVASRQPGTWRVDVSQTKAMEHKARLTENAVGRQLGSTRRLLRTMGRARSYPPLAKARAADSAGARDETSLCHSGAIFAARSLSAQTRLWTGAACHENLPAERAAAGWKRPCQRHACGHSTRKRGATAQVCGVTTRQGCPSGARRHVAKGGRRQSQPRITCRATQIIRIQCPCHRSFAASIVRSLPGEPPET